MLLILSALVVSLVSLPFAITNVSASGAQAAHEERAAEHTPEAAHDELQGEVPFDKPVAEMNKYLAPMNEMDLFPCSDCHDEDWEADPERRDLEEPHDELPGKFMNHDSENRWCLDCHSVKKRDSLRLLNGKLVQFDEYYRLCEQCHKRVYREWKMGVHGKRTGHWNGEMQYMHCTQCHNPHNPPFKPLKPMPAPRRPLNVRAMSSSDTH
jgi:nitrate/TMAO reductase-like tetraheme cytochrome c subunit